MGQFLFPSPTLTSPPLLPLGPMEMLFIRRKNTPCFLQGTFRVGKRNKHIQSAEFL